MKGTSMKLRKRIIWRNLIYFLVFFYIAIAECVDLYLSIYNNKHGYFPFSVNFQKQNESKAEQYTIDALLFALYYFCGFMLAVVRLMEPQVWKVAKTKAK